MSEQEAAAAVVEVPLTGIRRTAARHMVKAWQVPVFHLSVEVDMTNATTVRSVVEGATVSDLIVRASARALVAVPQANAHVSDDAVALHSDVNVGLAVATERGLVVPVIHRANALSLGDIADARRAIVDRARSGALTRDDMTGGTFTVSNLGMMGIDTFDAILNVPQAAILAVGATRERFRRTDGQERWVPMATLTVTCDHRALDGSDGARLLTTLAAELQGPVES
jgi:pyruvate dehydrogenase E2 component (dihydrolipoamide acetyltransferase)